MFISHSTDQWCFLLFKITINNQTCYENSRMDRCVFVLS